MIVSSEGTPTVISVSGGATQFPGLRWEELLSIADSAVSQGSVSGMRRIDEFLDRLAERSFEGRWEWTRQYGWTNDAEGGARNPRSARGSTALPEIQRFLSELG